MFLFSYSALCGVHLTLEDALLIGIELRITSVFPAQYLSTEARIGFPIGICYISFVQIQLECSFICLFRGWKKALRSEMLGVINIFEFIALISSRCPLTALIIPSVW